MFKKFTGKRKSAARNNNATPVVTATADVLKEANLENFAIGFEDEGNAIPLHKEILAELGSLDLNNSDDLEDMVDLVKHLKKERIRNLQKLFELEDDDLNDFKNDLPRGVFKILKQVHKALDLLFPAEFGSLDDWKQHFFYGSNPTKYDKRKEVQSFFEASDEYLKEYTFEKVTLDKFEDFKPPGTHAALKTNMTPALKKHPKRGTPYFLIHELDNRIAKEDLTEKGDEMSVIGCSGCGKTRACFEYMARKFTIYIIGSDGETKADGNDGPNDVFKCTNAIRKHIRDYEEEFPERQDESEEGKVARKAHRRTIGVTYYKILLLTRLLVLRHLKRKFKDLTALEWLLCQQHPDKMSGEFDFSEFFIWMLKNGFKKATLMEATENISDEVTKTSYIVDEAQELMRVANFFHANSKVEKKPERASRYTYERSMFSVLVEAIRKTNFNGACIVTGTGISILNAEKEFTSGVAKETAIRVTPKRLSPDESKEYCAKYLTLPDDTDVVDAIFSKLEGRARLSANFISHVMTTDGNLSLEHMFDEYYRLQTSKTNSGQKFSNNSLYRYVSQVFGDGKEITEQDERQLRIGRVFRDMIVEYCMYSKALVKTTDSKAFELVESGVCFTEFTQYEGQIILCEPMVVAAAQNSLRNSGLLVLLMKDKLLAAVNPSARGFHYEFFVLMYLRQKFTNCTLSSLCEDYQSIDKLGEFGKRKFSIWKHEQFDLAEKVDNMVEWTKNTSQLVEKTRTPIGPTYVMPEEDAGPDIVSWLKFPATENQPEKFMLLLIQCKLKKNTSFGDAYRTVVPQITYKKKDKFLEGNQKFIELLKHLDQNKKFAGVLRMSLCHPESRLTDKKRDPKKYAFPQYPAPVYVGSNVCKQKQQKYPRMNDMYYVVSNENSTDFFGENEVGDALQKIVQNNP